MDEYQKEPLTVPCTSLRKLGFPWNTQRNFPKFHHTQNPHKSCSQRKEGELHVQNRQCSALHISVTIWQAEGGSLADLFHHRQFYTAAEWTSYHLPGTVKSAHLIGSPAQSSIFHPRHSLWKTKLYEHILRKQWQQLLDWCGRNRLMLAF